MNRKRTEVFDDRALDLEAILHPSQLFERPADVLNDPDLSLKEKRAILASWASDACAVEAAPALRKTPRGQVVSFDDIMDALRALDKEACAAAAAGDRQRLARRRASFGRGGTGAGDQGAPLH
jgi:hypothetical protein